MSQLNTTFNAVSNVAFPLPMGGSATLRPMGDTHDTMRRLYRAADTLRGLRGQTEVARALNMSPQRLNNWEKRGISQAGANAAQALLGINSTWLLHGTGGMEAGAANLPTPSHPARIDPDRLAEAITALRQIAKETGWKYDPVTHPVQTVLAYEINCAMPDNPATADVIDFMARVAALSREPTRGRNERGESATTGADDPKRATAKH